MCVPLFKITQGFLLHLESYSLVDVEILHDIVLAHLCPHFVLFLLLFQQGAAILTSFPFLEHMDLIAALEPPCQLCSVWMLTFVVIMWLAPCHSDPSCSIPSSESSFPTTQPE